MEQVQDVVRAWASTIVTLVAFKGANEGSFTLSLVALQDDQELPFEILCEPTWSPMVLLLLPCSILAFAKRPVQLG